MLRLTHKNSSNGYGKVKYKLGYWAGLREIEVHIHGGMDVVSAYRKAGVSGKTFYSWQKKFGGMRLETQASIR